MHCYMSSAASIHEAQPLVAMVGGLQKESLLLLLVGNIKEKSQVQTLT